MLLIVLRAMALGQFNLTRSDPPEPVGETWSDGTLFADGTGWVE